MTSDPTAFKPVIPRDWTGHPAAHHPPYKTTVARSPRMPLLSVPATVSELTGPVFDGVVQPGEADLLTCHGGEGLPQGERIILHGRVLDQTGRPVPGALIELWQANASGRYRHKKDGYLAPLDPNFVGCGRVVTGEDGAYAFRTIRPGAYPWPNAQDSWRPAHIHLSLFGTMFCQRLVTQLYFEGDPLIARCPIVGSIADPAAVERLIARLDMANSLPFDALAWRFDIVLRGRRQTYFETRLEGL
ncbi:MAG: protocatechuate 3,4-dioxygenase subunit beta [Pseudomonadota bacterium]